MQVEKKFFTFFSFPPGGYRQIIEKFVKKSTILLECPFFRCILINRKEECLTLTLGF